jgi:hypothetical protein
MWCIRPSEISPAVPGWSCVLPLSAIDVYWGSSTWQFLLLIHFLLGFYSQLICLNPFPSSAFIISPWNYCTYWEQIYFSSNLLPLQSIHRTTETIFQKFWSDYVVLVLEIIYCLSDVLMNWSIHLTFLYFHHSISVLMLLISQPFQSQYPCLPLGMHWML